MMKNIIITLILSMICNLYSCKSGSALPTPDIKHGIATLHGQISGFNPDDNLNIIISASNPLLGSRSSVFVNTHSDGSFTVKIPVVYNTIGYISSELFESAVCLIPDEESHITIRLDINNSPSIIHHSTLPLTDFDLCNMTDILSNSLDSVMESRNGSDLKNLLSEIEIMTDYLAKSELSDAGKQLATLEARLWMLDMLFFEAAPNENAYYILKEFGLNDPLYLYTTCYPKIIERILDDQHLKIQDIADMPPKAWVSYVASILGEYIGFNEGLFYDMLVSNIYSRQIENLLALSDIQIENIKTHFENAPVFTNIILSKNDELISMKAIGESLNKTPDTTNELLLDSILKEYRGKIVVVDFWATWCVPCIKSMSETTKVKEKYKDSDVVFVYITDTSSPNGLWLNMAHRIGGEHYYLNSDQWQYILNQLQFDAIPHYLFVNRDGIIQHSHIGSIKADRMEELLLKTIR